MRRNMDEIQFESKCEIDEVVSALETFIEEHPNARERSSAERLKNLLDVMYMVW